ncbi:hypothetical protein HHK36_000708 [Tetracentron sinense]|uniref:Uncharacterized protein n=1 Tax=Tetracentron sinense TaxID=13715 RepID=A0A834ZRJ2_TETSI|nr:hypothetical protein HHK36_000708 [Tetracentron sinense]
MGCFFGCFRFKDDNRPQTHLVSDAVSSKSRDALVSRNRLASLLLSEEPEYDAFSCSKEKEGSPCKDITNHTLGSPQPGFDGNLNDKELKDEMCSTYFQHFELFLDVFGLFWAFKLFLDVLGALTIKSDPDFQRLEEDSKGRVAEARFLKACGTLLQTPAEIQKTSVKAKDLNDGDSEGSKFHSWLLSTSIKKLHWEEQPDQVPAPTVKFCELLGKEPGSPKRTPSSCTSEGKNTRRFTRSPENNGVETLDTTIKIHINQLDNSTFSSLTPRVPAATSHKNKCVRFECESDVAFLPSRIYTTEAARQSLKQSDSATSCDELKSSPYPTPLKLTDEMQTPGTVYPANLENLTNGKNVRIRSQYVYPVLNPVENFCQWKALKEEDSDTHEQLSHLRESLKHSENAIPEHTYFPNSDTSAMVCGVETTVGKELKVDASLCHWLKSSSSPMDEKSQSCGTISSGKSYSGKTPEMDRPIIGIVAAHWNEDEPSRISPKWWDGNGIPNSTNKYKEDQKVSWHATPFEERLEKALSEETSLSQRKNVNGTPIDFDENEESDSAISQLQSSAFPELVSI